MVPAIRDEAGPSFEPTTPFRLVAVTSISWRSVGRCNESPLALLGPLRDEDTDEPKGDDCIRTAKSTSY